MPLSRINSGAIQDNVKLQGDVVGLAGGTEAERISSPEEGMLRYNTTLKKMEIYNGGNWDQLNTQQLQIAMSIALA